ncbi:MAG: outer membrane protein assembly factor BamD [Bacteroidales bacterium]
MNRKIVLPLLICSILVLVSCSKYQKLLKGSDNDLKYEQAIKFYEKKDYYRALQLFDQLSAFFKGTEKAERIAYFYAYCYYNQNDFLMGSYYFKRFSTSYPKSPYAEECAYMAAFCNYQESPRSSLDQSSTQDALKELQLFINMYPSSEKVSKANDLIDELRAKLEKKAYDIGMLYYKMNDYKAAIVTFKNIIKDFPDTPHREDLLYFILKSNYKYASKSIDTKRKERFTAAIESYDDLVSSFPKTLYIKEARTMQKDSQNEILN